MRKHLLLLLCSAICQAAANGQGLTQSADGKSTIPIKGAAVSIDLAKTELAIGYNNYDRIVKTDSLRFLYGLSVKVKNEEGIGSLFSSGDLVPSGNANVMAGFTKAFNHSDADAVLRENTRIQAEFDAWAAAFRANLNDSLGLVILAECAVISDDNKRRQTLDQLQQALEHVKANPERLDENIPDAAADPFDITLVKRKVRAFAKKEHGIFTARKTTLQAAATAIPKEWAKLHPSRLTAFLFGGISAISFKKFNQVDSANLAKSFTNTNERGGNFGIGVNYQYNDLWLGLTYSYESSNNFSALTKTDYTLRTTTTINSQALVQENKVTGYAGKYGKVELNDFNIDLVYDWMLDKEGKNHVLFNPYLRASIFSRDTSLLVNKTNLGSGFYFFQNSGKFLGGFYIELPDINNNAEKAKPVSEQNLRPAFKRLSFGIVTKFNIGTLFSW